MILVIRISGMVDVPRAVAEALHRIKLRRKYGRNNLTRIFLHVFLLGLFISLVNFLPVIGTFINLFVTTPFIFIYNYQLLLLCKQYWFHADKK